MMALSEYKNSCNIFENITFIESSKYAVKVYPSEPNIFVNSSSKTNKENRNEQS